MRLFLGTFLSTANQDFYGDAIAGLVHAHPGVLRPIPRRSAHLTYAFCADTGPHEAPAVAAAIRTVTVSARAIDIRLGGLRLIAAGPSPRLIVTEVQSGGDALRRLVADLSQSCRSGFPDLDWKPSREPHVTLVRFNKHATFRDRDAVERTLGWTDVAAREARSDRIDRVEVIRSELTAAGPAYASLAAERLS